MCVNSFNDPANAQASVCRDGARVTITGRQSTSRNDPVLKNFRMGMNVPNCGNVQIYPDGSAFKLPYCWTPGGPYTITVTGVLKDTGEKNRDGSPFWEIRNPQGIVCKLIQPR